MARYSPFFASLLNLYRSLIKLRKEHPALQKGDWHALARGHDGVLAYRRRCDEESCLVFLNFTRKRKKVHTGKKFLWSVLLSTHRNSGAQCACFELELGPYEATVLLKNNSAAVSASMDGPS